MSSSRKIPPPEVIELLSSDDKEEDDPPPVAATRHHHNDNNLGGGGGGGGDTAGGIVIEILDDDSDDDDGSEGGGGDGGGNENGRKKSDEDSPPPSSSPSKKTSGAATSNNMKENEDRNNSHRRQKDEVSSKNMSYNRNNKKVKSSSGSSRSKHHHDYDDAEEEEVVVAGPTSRSFVPADASAKAAVAAATKNDDDEDEDDDIELIGSTGKNALADFPHARENCVQFPFNSNPVTHCPNCFCFVCDGPARDCKEWNNSHHKATYNDPYWKSERERMKNERTKAPQPPLVASVPTAAAAPPPTHRPAPYNSNSNYNRNLPVKTLLDAVTRVYPTERSPPYPLFLTPLHHYQKQSLAFMQDVEAGQSPWDMNGTATRGGWLCSDVGMGKTAIVIALVASTPLNLSNLPKLHGRVRSKATVVMTSVSLMGQWEDECKKHAPNLRVVRFHPSSQTSKRSKPTISQIMNADIVISSATFCWGDSIELNSIMFHRVVQDESHLFYNRSVSADPRKARMIPAANRWCVTATPMTSTPQEMSSQSCFLGMDSCRRLVQDLEFLKQHMIRHTKTQRINGSSALALPKSTTTVKKIKMTPDECRTYKTNLDGMKHSLHQLKGQSVAKYNHVWNRVFCLTSPLVTANSSKINALKASILALLQRDPNMRAVVFTQHRQMLDYVKGMVVRLGHGIQLYSFDGSSSSRKRDNAIRSFQSTAQSGPAVFVITLQTGAVGVTLTAASHVFLMEPCINPADEVQAAGRISRLGQTKEIEVTKFFYKGTLESNVIKLHKKIAAGKVQFTKDGLSNAALRVLLRNH